MKAILIVIVVVAVMVLLGWLTFWRDGDRPGAAINTETIQQDTDRAAEAARDVAHEAAAGAERLADEVQRTDVDLDVQRDRASDEEPAAGPP